MTVPAGYQPLRQLAGVLAAVQECKEIGRAIDVALCGFSELLGVDRGVILLLDAQGSVKIAHEYLASTELQSTLGMALTHSPVLDYMMTHDKPMPISDISKLAFKSQDIISRGQIKSTVICSIRFQGKSLGCLSLQTCEAVREWTEAEAAQIDLFCGYLAAFVRVAQLSEEVRSGQDARQRLNEIVDATASFGWSPEATFELFDRMLKPAAPASGGPATLHSGSRVSDAASDRASILVVDDHQELLENLGAWLRDEGYRVAMATSGNEALAIAKRSAVDVAICDVELPGLPGLELVRLLKEIDPAIEVVVLTGHATVDRAVTALRHGVLDFLQKPVLDPSVLQVAIERALVRRHRAGPRSEGSEAEPVLQAALQVTSVARLANAHSLTPREHEVLELLVQGLETREIADKACLTERTVRNYLSTIYGKLGVTNRTQAVIRCQQVAANDGQD